VLAARALRAMGEASVCLPVASVCAGCKGAGEVPKRKNKSSKRTAKGKRMSSFTSPFFALLTLSHGVSAATFSVSLPEVERGEAATSVSLPPAEVESSSSLRSKTHLFSLIMDADIMSLVKTNLQVRGDLANFL